MRMGNIAQHKFCRKEDFRKTEKWDVDIAEGPCTKKQCELKRAMQTQDTCEAFYELSVGVFFLSQY